jgi:hypothetical protein
MDELHNPVPFPLRDPLNPVPFPLGKRLLPIIRFPFPLGKRLLQTIWFPFPLGKGLGVRFLTSATTLNVQSAGEFTCPGQ